MKVFNYKTVTAEPSECCSTNTTIRKLIAQEANSAVAIFEMQRGGYSQLDKHQHRQEIFVLNGEGLVFDGEKTYPIQAGDMVLVEANEPHQVRNTGAKPLEFLCITHGVNQ